MSIDRPLTLDRRAFLGGIGGAAAAALVPVTAGPSVAPGPEEAAGAALTDWTIDDMWGVHTRYAEPIGFGRAQVREPRPSPDPVDEAFVA